MITWVGPTWYLQRLVCLNESDGSESGPDVLWLNRIGSYDAMLILFDCRGTDLPIIEC